MSDQQQAVLVCCAFDGEVQFAPLYDLEDKLVAAISAAHVGELDGNEVGEGKLVLYMYGVDAEKLFFTIAPVLREATLTRSATGDDQIRSAWLSRAFIPYLSDVALSSCDSRHDRAHHTSDESRMTGTTPMTKWLRRIVVAFLLGLSCGSTSCRAASLPDSDTKLFHSLVGNWKECDEVNGAQMCVLVTYRSDNTFKEITSYKGAIALHAEGRWRVAGRRLLYTVNSSSPDQMPRGTERGANILEAKPSYFTLATNDGPPHKWESTNEHVD